MNLYAGLLFQSGHIADPNLALSLARPDAPTVAAHVVPAKTTPHASRLRWLVEELVLLGGRPVSRGHLDDINEPFPPLHGCH